MGLASLDSLTVTKMIIIQIKGSLPLPPSSPLLSSLFFDQTSSREASYHRAIETPQWAFARIIFRIPRQVYIVDGRCATWPCFRPVP